MAFRNSSTYSQRVYYSPNGTAVIKMPAGNLFAGMVLDINTLVDVVTNPASNAPDFQIARMVKRMYITMGSTTVWDISGESLALLFSYSGPMQAPGNATIAGAVGAGKAGRLILPIDFAPADAIKPWDYLMDTRVANYEVRFEFRDLTVAGTLFGTIGGTIATTNANNYIDVEFEKLALKPSPDGTADALVSQAPLMRGIIERNSDIQTNVSASFPLPDYQTFRNIWLWTTTEANSNQTVGTGAVFTDKLEIRDSQANTYQSVKAAAQLQKTALRWKNANLNAGFYELPMLKFGATADAETSSQQIQMYLLASVLKQANQTNLRYICDTAIVQKPT